jgi:hypothetical protein
MKDMNVPTWRKLGFQPEYCQGITRNLVTLSAWWDGPPQDVDKVEGWAGTAIGWGTLAFTMGAMGYEDLPPPFDDWRETGRRVVAAAICYFFGAWREHFHYLLRELDRASARAQLAWIDYYREGLAVACSLGDWKSVDQLVKWPGPDLRWDEGTDDRTREDNAYQIWLASRLRGEAADKSSAQLQLIETGSRRRPKMLLSAANALFADDGQSLAKTLAACLRDYRKELRPNRVDFGMCLDATTLWHLARRRGLGELSLGDDEMLFIPRP